jgi:hypothetical protein
MSEVMPDFHTGKVGRRSWLKRRYACGHRASRSFVIILPGENGTCISQTQFCPECYLADLKSRRPQARCGRCGAEILPGDSVALCSAKLPGLRPDVTTVNGDQVLLCLKMDCSFPGHAEGYWTLTGYHPVCETTALTHV